MVAQCSSKTGDIQDTDPRLLPLQPYDGQTQTYGLFPDSPAIDAVPVENCTDTSDNPITVDQRGLDRPFGTACDIGAFEFGGGSDPGEPVIVGIGEETITPDGGLVTAGEGDNVSIEIAAVPGALAEDTVITVELYEADDPALPPIPDEQETMNHLSHAFAFKPEGLQFAKPVQITITYLQEEIDDYLLIEDLILPLLLVVGVWVTVNPCVQTSPLDPDPCLLNRNTELNRLIIATTHFSIYSVAGLVLSDTLTVDSILDTVDALPGNGICGDSEGRCTLRAAITAVAANRGRIL